MAISGVMSMILTNIILPSFNLLSSCISSLFSRLSQSAQGGIFHRTPFRRSGVFLRGVPGTAGMLSCRCGQSRGGCVPFLHDRNGVAPFSSRIPRISYSSGKHTRTGEYRRTSRTKVLWWDAVLANDFHQHRDECPCGADGGI